MKMGRTEKDANQSDPLGLNQFALTESAHDLLTSLKGIYARLQFHESKRSGANTESMARWKERTHQLQSLYLNTDWANTSLLQQLISTLSTEYKQATQEEADQMSQLKNATRSRDLFPA